MGEITGEGYRIVIVEETREAEVTVTTSGGSVATRRFRVPETDPEKTLTEWAKGILRGAEYRDSIGMETAKDAPAPAPPPAILNNQPLHHQTPESEGEDK